MLMQTFEDAVINDRKKGYLEYKSWVHDRTTGLVLDDKATWWSRDTGIKPRSTAQNSTPLHSPN